MYRRYNVQLEGTQVYGTVEVIDPQVPDDVPLAIRFRKVDGGGWEALYVIEDDEGTHSELPACFQPRRQDLAELDAALDRKLRAS